MARSLTNTLGWVALGTELFSEAMGSLADASLAGPSGLPGWSRAHLIAHVTGNARGLGNLVTWARTGVETPMYASVEQRNADIEAGAKLAPTDLRDVFAQSAIDLAIGFDSLSEAGWSAEVRTIQGRTIPASEIPWLRSREVMIHAVDLDAGIGFDRMPDGFLIALIDDIVGRRSTMAGHPAIALEGAGQRWEIAGDGQSVTVNGTLPEIAAYVSGRAPHGPELPAWL
jgi:maleylpyruvate isomerase